MPSKRPFRAPKQQGFGIEPASYGKRGPRAEPAIDIGAWAESMSHAGGGAQEVMVKVTGGGTSGEGAQAHFEYIDRHGKLEIHTDDGQELAGKTAAAELVNDWDLDIPIDEYAGHSRRSRIRTDGKRARPIDRRPKQVFNIMFSMKEGTPPEKVLAGAQKFAREKFALQHRYAMVLHTDQKHPHVHMVVKAESEVTGQRLNIRKAMLRQWRQDFAQYMREQGIEAVASSRPDRGLAKANLKNGIYQSAQRKPDGSAVPTGHGPLVTREGDSTFMRRKLEGLRKELAAKGKIEDRESYRKLLDLRAKVLDRYTAGIQWLEASARHEEARRLGVARNALPAVRTERQMIQDILALQAGRPVEPGKTRGGRARS